MAIEGLEVLTVTSVSNSESRAITIENWPLIIVQTGTGSSGHQLMPAVVS